MSLKSAIIQYVRIIFTVFLLLPGVAVSANDFEANATVAVKTDGFPSYFPSFSWEKVPIYLHFGDANGLLTDAQVATTASATNLICIEKQYGYKVLGAAELGAKRAFSRFKAVNPNIKCLFYLNSVYAWPFTTATKVFHYGEVRPRYRGFLLRNAETNVLYEQSDWNRRGKHVYVFNVLNPAFRAWWANTAGKYVRETGADGLFVDQAPGLLWLRPKMRKEVERAQVELMRMVRNAIGPDKILLLNNAARFPALFKIGDGFMMEHYKPSLLTKEGILEDWALLKKISRAKKLAIWRIGVEIGHRKLTEARYEALSKKEIAFYLAAFLVGAQRYSYFEYNWGWDVHTGPLIAYDDFNKALGKPLENYTRPDPNGWVFRREFEHASVWVDLNTREGRIEWK